jgi:alpha-1,6-mannosyltransferase
MLKQKPIVYACFLLSLLLYFALGYFIERHETSALFVCYFLLFAAHLFVYWRTAGEIEFWIVGGLLFRAVLVFSVPALSDDFYRFIWDGRLMASGYHPFANVPSFYIETPSAIIGIDPELFQKLNSKEYFTVYPPIAQFIFWLSVKVSPHSIYGSMIIMKLIILGCEIGSIMLIAKLIKKFGLPLKNILLYALNPLVILELTGNVHFEAVMIFFILLSIWFLVSHQLIISSVAMACAICVKLIPLIFLPLLIRTIGWKKSSVYFAITALVTFLLFIPLYDAHIIIGFTKSLGYYFQKFEFNASIYYLVREWGFVYYGYNIIQTVGWKLAGIAGILILIIAFIRIKKENLDNLDFITKAMWCLLIFFLFTTTLHPWYIIPVLALSIFTPYRFPVLWTGLIFLTYAGYSTEGFHENWLIIIIEYMLLISYVMYELWTSRKIAS